MESKAYQERHMQGSQYCIQFQICKKVQFGKALFICGNLPELGQWSSSRAFRLNWTEGHNWIGQIQLNPQQKDPFKIIEFKFMISTWETTQTTSIEWQRGEKNRKINPFCFSSSLHQYYARWNLQHFVFLLKTEDYDEKETYFIEGSLQQLGSWNERQLMNRLTLDKADIFFDHWKNNPEFGDQTSFSRILTYEIWVDRNILAFNYLYVCLHNSIECQDYPGRTYNVMDTSAFSCNNRIAELDSMGSKIILDESTFDKIVLERFTNQIYFATHIHHAVHFYKILQKKATFIFAIMTTSQEDGICNVLLKKLCKQNGILFQSKFLDEEENQTNKNRILEIVQLVEKYIIQGHRVCLNFSSKVMRFVTINILYLILVRGYSFSQALEINKKTSKPSEYSFKLAKQIFNFISSKFNRGTSQICYQ